MKILIVSQYFYPENFRINDLCNELIDRGHEVSVLTGIPNYPLGSFFKGYNFYSIGRDQKFNFSVFRVPLFPRFQSKGWQLALNYLSFAISASLFGILFIARKRKFDVIFAYEPSPITVGIPAVVFKKIFKVPVIFWVQDLWPESISAVTNKKFGFSYRIASRITHWIYVNCNKILIQSEGFREPCIEQGAKSGNIIYFPNWAESIFSDNALESTLANNPYKQDEYFNIVFAGNLGEAQSIETIIRAANESRSTKLRWIFIGDGRKKAWLETKVSQLNLQEVVVFLGMKKLAEMPTYLHFADCLLVTLKKSSIFSLTIPGKLQSYMAIGKPLLGSLDGISKDIINESASGMASDAEDFKTLAQNAIHLSELSPDELLVCAKSAREYYKKNFNRESLISQLENIMISEARL